MPVFSRDLFPRAAPEPRIAAYYFCQAMSVGAINAFAGIWLTAQGMSPQQIGVIFAVPVMIIIFVGVPMGRLADRAADWRQVIVAGALASAGVPLLLPAASGFWQLLLVWTACVVTQMMILPITDAAAMRLSRRRSSDFSVLYAWKTVGYLGTILLCGGLLSHWGTAAFLPIFVLLSLLRGVLALGLPNFRNPDAATAARRQVSSFVRTVGWGFMLPLVGWGLVHCTHFILNGFLGLLWHRQGLDANLIGILIAVSGVAETLMFLAFKRFSFRFKPRDLILLSCLAAVVRWGALAFSPGLVWLFPLQCLQALTYALGFLACTNFIADHAHEDVAAEAQSTFAIVQAALGVAALLLFGRLAAQFDAAAFLFPAALAACGAMLVVWSRRLALWRRPGPRQAS